MIQGTEQMELSKIDCVDHSVAKITSDSAYELAIIIGKNHSLEVLPAFSSTLTEQPLYYSHST